MKSTREDLENRGKLQEADLEKYRCLERQQALDLLESGSPLERTAAVRLLAADEEWEDEDLAPILLNRLGLEKSLYTKIEICAALEKGKQKTARQMISWLGRIGRNQHRCLSDRVSRKTSYPLPRDIIARSLARMDPAVLPLLFAVLHSKDEKKISEAIDAIGFMIFYHADLPTEENLQRIIAAMNEYSANEVILWKCVLCLSAFPLPASSDVLKGEIEAARHPLIAAEAARSLALIAPRSWIECRR